MTIVFAIKMGQLQGKYVLNKRDIEYLSKHTKMTREDVQSRYDQFMIRHPDGKIPKTEFLSTIQACYSDCDIKKLDDYVYRMYDKNKDGFVDFKEFTIVLYMLSSGSPEDKLLQIFDIFDINRTGFISQLAMTKMVREMYNVIDIRERPPGMNPISFANFIFNDMDSNRDGQISKDEFIKACLDDESFSSILAIKLLESINSN